ncbi:DUF602-domain-containing protein [Athelia psychrophila]|uniref:DUF602-domain-containing protein n=1 Tax=Athelia psychrophila TaxID=1759441 RepID=A0A166HNM5_9AGAM|nr:DUF602-domain-containing protein [Fibularhizoctonia sp. CBS 109695]
MSHACHCSLTSIFDVKSRRLPLTLLNNSESGAMGNDGGSIPDRRDLVKTKVKAEQADKANQTRARWFFCALSKQELREPIVACALGKLYNKDAIIVYLLDNSAYGDGEKICSHIRSLKVGCEDAEAHAQLRALVEKAVETSTSERPQFACPLMMKEMNGVQPFVYILTCGCVFSQAGLKTVSGSGSASPKNDDDDAEKPKQQQMEVCPQCAAKFDKATDVLTLNPSMVEEERMFAAMLVRRAAEPPKKSKKRKGAPADEGGAPAAKKTNNNAHASISAASRAVVSSLALEQAKTKAGMSEAVKSLYSKKGEERKETFMTMGTFTRYA